MKTEEAFSTSSATCGERGEAVQAPALERNLTPAQRRMEATCDHILHDIGNPVPLDVTALLDSQGLRLQVGGPGFPRNIRGLLHLSNTDAVVAVRDDLPEAAQRFTICHEVGHFALVEHRRVLLRQCSEMDLSPAARGQWERAANFMAAALLFRGELDASIGDYDLSMASVSRFADHAMAGLEASFRRFVERNPRPVWGVVCEPAVLAEDGPAAAGVRYLVRSAPARWVPLPVAMRVEPGGRYVRPVASLFNREAEASWMNVGATTCEVYTTGRTVFGLIS